MSGPVKDLLGRAGGRAELLVRFSNPHGYELVDWNPVAAELFHLDAQGPGEKALPWGELPSYLAHYLSQALQVVSGAPAEASRTTP